MILQQLSNWATLLIAIFGAVVLWAIFCSGSWR